MKTNRKSSNNRKDSFPGHIGVDGFPRMRLRRLRKTEAIRELVKETRLSPSELIAPVFVQEGLKRPAGVSTMPGIYRLPLSNLTSEVETLLSSGIRSVIIFGIPVAKDVSATQAFDERGIVQQSIKTLRNQFGEKLVIVSDVCLCQYTSHGHCGLVIGGKVDNDSSIQTLAKVAVTHANAGADIVAPSAMMDGQVQALRTALDASGNSDTAIMSYSAKQASPLYAPFRDAAHSTPEFGNRYTYQMSFANSREAFREIESDISESADIIMIKPALPYLDLIREARIRTDLPICAYSVSGEYALIKAAASRGWIDEKAVTLEFMTAIKRAGADMIISYQAKQIASFLQS